MQLHVTQTEIKQALGIPLNVVLVIDAAEGILFDGMTKAESVAELVRDVKYFIPDAKLNAIKCFRELFGVGLKASKDIIEIMAEERRQGRLG